MIREYRVQVLDTLHGGRHMTVERADGKDGITWDELQRLKDESLGPDSMAVEVFPRADEVINERNRRHLWEVPEGFLPFNLARR